VMPTGEEPKTFPTATIKSISVIFLTKTLYATSLTVESGLISNKPESKTILQIADGKLGMSKINEGNKVMMSKINFGSLRGNCRSAFKPGTKSNAGFGNEGMLNSGSDGNDNS